MQPGNDDAAGDVPGDVVEEVAVLNRLSPCESDAVRDIVDRAIRQFRSDESGEETLIHESMLGVVRGTVGTRMDARATARGAILGVLQATEVLRTPVARVFADAAHALIVETAAKRGQFEGTVRGVLDAAWNYGHLNRQQVDSAVAIAILDATMESMRYPHWHATPTGAPASKAAIDIQGRMCGSQTKVGGTRA